MLQNWTKVNIVLWILDKLVYISMLGLGMYFIYQGEIVKRFQLKMTNFAVYEDKLTEPPIVVTYIFPVTNVTFKEDFQIQFKAGMDESNGWQALDYGENLITEANLSLSFQNLYPGTTAQSRFPNVFVLKLLKYHSTSVPSLRLRYVFESSKPFNDSKIHFSLRADNNLGSCEGRFGDGDVQTSASNLGKWIELSFVKEKRIYLAGIKMCRQESFNDVLNEKVLQNINSMCKTPCKPEIWDGMKDKGMVTYLGFCPALRLSKGIDELPFCGNQSQSACFYESYKLAHNFVSRYTGPCNKIEYHLKREEEYASQNHVTTFHASFDPPRMTVYQEYLVCDLVAMISAIGGTLGICVGFSFTDLASSALLALKKIAKSKKQSGKVSDSNLFLKSYSSSSHPASLEEIANTVINLQSQVAKQSRVHGQLEHNMNEQMKKIVALENDAPKNRRKILERKNNY